MSGPDPLAYTLATVVIVAVLIYLVGKLGIALWYKVGISLCIVFLALGVVGVRFGFIPLAIIAGASLLLILVSWLSCWRRCGKSLANIAKLADPMEASCSYVAAFARMKRINPCWLTPKQSIIYNRYRVLCNIYLGNCRVAEVLLNEGDFEEAFKHFSLHIIADAAGDRARSDAELNHAFGVISKRTDSFIILQLEHNRAIGRINAGQFSTANAELEKLRTKVKRENVRNKAFLNLLYENLVLNKTRLGLPDRGAAEGARLIDEYAETLDPGNAADWGALFNMRLMLLRELGAGGEEKAKLFADEVSSTLGSKCLSDGQRAIAMASLARIAWADALNPARILGYFGTCDLRFGDLSPEERIAVFKNLSIMLEGLATSDSHVDEIRKTVSSYFDNGAQSDLDAWERKLPAEAIKQRAHIHRERAALFQRRGGTAKQVVSALEEAITLLEQGLQIMEALELRWEQAKLLVLISPEDAKARLTVIEKRLAALGQQPSLGYPYYEVGLCYGMLGMGSECRVAYAKAVSFETSMDHYAPNVRMDVARACFCARFFLMLDILRERERLFPFLSTDEGRRWLESYPERMDTMSTVILLGRFLGLRGSIPVGRRLMGIDDNRGLACYWLDMPDIGLAFDPNTRSRDGGCGAVFLQDRNPLIEVGPSFESMLRRQGLEPFPAEGKFCDESDLSDKDRAAVKDVLDALNLVCEHEVPSVDELHRRFLDGCVDVPVG